MGIKTIMLRLPIWSCYRVCVLVRFHIVLSILQGFKIWLIYQSFCYDNLDSNNLDLNIEKFSATVIFWKSSNDTKFLRNEHPNWNVNENEYVHYTAKKPQGPFAPSIDI